MEQYHRPLELVDRPKPEPSAHTDVVVRIGGAGVCATDLHALEGLMEFAGVSLPRVLGPLSSQHLPVAVSRYSGQRLAFE